MSALTESNAQLHVQRQTLLKTQEKQLLKLTADSTSRLHEIGQSMLDSRNVILELKMQGNECMGVSRLEA
ncbi:hypothetical protein AEQ67_13115 [Pseudomonas sp. RIT-PI-q]|uniref:hypothetical protein n=1 Tax=Pseudomonas sp. RIT-PI-q TaxID=1690247 RepID=UPI0006CD2E99|nr:hypothetical protein [Pseudomonas sp. RIT-PI-q]KPG98293.1 hypothetical protein AEQ67_13115 [Pseudomonas sp. RIT-PI-q]